MFENIKIFFLKEGVIEGVWIFFEKEFIWKFVVWLSVYWGGFFWIEDGEIVYYEFLVDVYIGIVLDILRKKGVID